MIACCSVFVYVVRWFMLCWEDALPSNKSELSIKAITVDQQTIYLNHAGTSWPKPTTVSEAVVEAMSTCPSQWGRRFYEAHQDIADFFGVADPAHLLFTPGCTSSLAVAISDANVAPGQRVLTSQWEHHALHRPLLKLANAGVQVDYIPAKINGDTDTSVNFLDLGWLEDELSKGDVAMVAITAACNVTGELLPYKEVIRLARKHDAMVLIDAAQIVGWSKLDLDALGADMVAFGGHKGLQAPWGIGGLYVADRARMQCISAVCELPGTAADGKIKSPRPDYCDVGSVDQFALAGLQAAIKMLNSQDLAANLANARNQVKNLKDALSEIDKIKFFGASDPGNSMPTLAFSIGDKSSSEIAGQLKKEGVIVGSGLQCAPLAHEQLGSQDTGLIRLSVGIGQPDEQINEAIQRIMRYAGCDSRIS